MVTCKDCKCFFITEENPEKGDCVERVVDPRQAYYKAKPVDAAALLLLRPSRELPVSRAFSSSRTWKERTSSQRQTYPPGGPSGCGP